MVENDLVAARQADRSLGSQDFSRFETLISNILSLWSNVVNIFKHMQFFCQQIVDNGPLDVCKFRRNQLVPGALADGQGIGEAEKGEAEVNYGAHSQITEMNLEMLTDILT